MAYRYRPVPNPWQFAVLDLVSRNSVKPKRPLKGLWKITQKIPLVRSLQYRLKLTVDLKLLPLAQLWSSVEMNRLSMHAGLLPARSLQVSPPVAS